MAKYTEAQKRSILKYQAEHAMVKITIDKEVKDQWVKYAEEKEISLTALIVHSVNLEIAQDKYAREHAEDYKEDIKNLQDLI